MLFASQSISKSLYFYDSFTDSVPHIVSLFWYFHSRDTSSLLVSSPLRVSCEEFDPFSETSPVKMVEADFHWILTQYSVSGPVLHTIHVLIMNKCITQNQKTSQIKQKVRSKTRCTRGDVPQIYEHVQALKSRILIKMRTVKITVVLPPLQANRLLECL